jgi:hypothetical protein
MVYCRTDTLQDFTNMATRFAATGLTGSFGETGPSSWSFAGTTAARVGSAVAYMIDMYRAFFASRGITHDGRVAWWPANIGYAAYGSSVTPFDAYHQQYALLPSIKTSTNEVFGSTADALQLYTWTGSTASQLSVLADSLYVSAGLSAFTSFVDEISASLQTAVAARPSISGPALLASEYEDWPGDSRRVFNNGIGTEEMGSWMQAVNDPRALTYRFFDRYTLFEMWGATGGSASAFRSPHQRSQPFTITACDGSGSITVTSSNIDINWTERANFLNRLPGWNNFYTSLIVRHREHLLNRGYTPLRTRFPSMLIGNYQNTASSRRYPIHQGKIHSYIYSCDVGPTGNNSEFGQTSGTTGTFVFDYSCPVLYARNPGNDITLQDGYSNFIPGYATVASSGILDRYSGAWGTSAVIRIGSNTGLLSQGGFNADYKNFLQYLSAEGITGTVGGGTAEGYTGGNILDVRNYWLQSAKNMVDATRNTLDYFEDTRNKQVVPWIGNIAFTYRSIFSLTANSSGSTVFNDANGLSGYFARPNSPVFADYNANIIKYCIQNHDITDFFVFDPEGSGGLSAGLQSLDFWNDVIQTLVIDSSSVAGPTADAGASQTLTAANGTTTSVILDGSGSTGVGLTPGSYVWSSNSTNIATGATANVVFAVGNYTVQLLVTDSNGRTGADTTSIIVNANSAPSANAGADQTLAITGTSVNVVLDGSASSDTDGTIQSYTWTRNSSTIATGATASVNFAIGVHTVILTVVDNLGRSASDSVTITIQASGGSNNLNNRGPGSAASTSVVVFGGKLYTRSQYEQLLQAFYPNLLR